jgi:hypothetical protein
MQNAKPSSNDIYEAALKLYDRQTLASMSRPTITTLGSLICDLLEDYPNPTPAQLEGLKEMFEHHFTMIAFAPSSPLSED